jgi:hypothetical protein
MASPCLSCGYVCIILVRLCADLNLYVIMIVGRSQTFSFSSFFEPVLQLQGGLPWHPKSLTIVKTDGAFCPFAFTFYILNIMITLVSFLGFINLN